MNAKTFADQSKSATRDEFSSTEPKFSSEGMSPGTSGVVVAVQLPRVGVGLGLLGASSVVFIDLVNVLTTTNSAGVATLNPSASGCLRSPPTGADCGRCHRLGRAWASVFVRAGFAAGA